MRLVIAGTREEANAYIMHAGLGRGDARCVTGPETLRGLSYRPEDVVLVGSWWAHPLWPGVQTELRRQLGADGMAHLTRDFAAVAA